MSKVNILRNVYLILLIVIFLLMVLTPWIIRGGVSFIADEESIEVISIALLFGTGYFIYYQYKKEVEKNKKELTRLEQDKNSLEERLDDAFKYIGKVNIQIQEIKSVFSGIEKYPARQQDIKYIFEYLSFKILSIVDVDWVLLRIVDLSKAETLREFCAVRGGGNSPQWNISNKELLKNKLQGEYQLLKSTQNNLNLKAFCVFPKNNFSEDQKVLIGAIIGQLEMLFIIFTSLYYKNSRNEISYKN